MSGYGKYALVVIVAAIVAGIACWIVRPGPLARGGVRVVLQVAPRDPADWPKDRATRLEKMEAVRRTILNRLRGAGLPAEPIVTIEGDDKVLIEAPGVKDAQSLSRGLIGTAALEFYYLKDIQNPNNPMGKWRMEPAMAEDKAYIFTDPRGVTIDSLKQPQEVLEKVVDVAHNKPILTGAYLLPNASANLNARNQTVINIEFNGEGTDIFRKFTRSHVGDYLAVFFDGKLLTAPSINEAIPSGKAEITGFKSVAEAKQIAEYLNAGALPVPLKVVTAEDIEPGRGRRR